MSTQDVPADIRYTAEKLPAHLGKDPSEKALKDWFSAFGYVWLCQITNYSGDTVKFNNPYYDVSGEIAPGKTESYNTKGYLPYWSYNKRYEITYYNQAFKDWKKISIKDLEGNWWVSFDHDGDDEDIRTTRPASIATVAGINLYINGNGYEIYNAVTLKLIGRISFQPAA